jgi:hypothetical protein
MGRFGDWEKGPLKRSLRVEVVYEYKHEDKWHKSGVVIVISKDSLNPERDAKDQTVQRLQRVGRPFRVLAVRKVPERSDA